MENSAPRGEVRYDAQGRAYIRRPDFDRELDRALELAQDDAPPVRRPRVARYEDDDAPPPARRRRKLRGPQDVTPGLLAINLAVVVLSIGLGGGAVYWLATTQPIEAPLLAACAWLAATLFIAFAKWGAWDRDWYAAKWGPLGAVLFAALVFAGVLHWPQSGGTPPPTPPAIQTNGGPGGGNGGQAAQVPPIIATPAPIILIATPSPVPIIPTELPPPVVAPPVVPAAPVEPPVAPAPPVEAPTAAPMPTAAPTAIPPTAAPLVGCSTDGQTTVAGVPIGTSCGGGSSAGSWGEGGSSAGSWGAP